MMWADLRAAEVESALLRFSWSAVGAYLGLGHATNAKHQHEEGKWNHGATQLGWI